MSADDDDRLLDAAADMAHAFALVCPEVFPETRCHDGWDGAAGAEIREHYEPYPHAWDGTLQLCKGRAARNISHEAWMNWMFGDYDPDIPMFIFRQALVMVKVSA